MDVQGAKRARAVVTGEVQGVGYRFFVERHARDRSLAGFARNEFDGSVTVEIQGPGPAVQEVLEALKTGPRSAIVEDVRVQWLDPVPGQSGFAIR